MSGFNFGQISEVVSQFMDSDFIDVKRDINGTLQEIYSNIPAHIAYSSTDNPDPNSVDIKPIIQSINVHIQNWVDVKNNDFIVAKKVDNNGNLIATYSGRCGNPVVSQGRKKVLITMNSTEPETPTPLPPTNYSTIKIYFENSNFDLPIQDSIEQKIEIGKPFNIIAPVIEGFTATNCSVNGIIQDTTSVYIPEVNENEYEIKFIYSVNEKPDYFRFLVNGLYTKDEGSLSNGYHLYKKVNIDLIEVNDDFNYTISCNDVNYTHDDNSKKLSITVGTKLVLMPSDVFVNIIEIVDRSNEKVTFIAKQYSPTENEKNAYIAGWYD